MVAIKRNVKCESCGIEVETVRTTTRFCSDRCRLRARKIRKNGRKSCKRCKEPIMGLQNVDYCSSECREMYRISKRTIAIKRMRCAGCGKSFVVKHKRKYCSGRCCYLYYYSAQKLANEVTYTNRCKECSIYFKTKRPKQPYCSSTCNRRYNNRRTEVTRRNRIIDNGKVDWSISIERLTKRDGKNCYLCNQKMNYSVDYNDNHYPSVEHIKPISKGGTHTWENVKLAHRKCNSEKSNYWIEK